MTTDGDKLAEAIRQGLKTGMDYVSDALRDCPDNHAIGHEISRQTINDAFAALREITRVPTHEAGEGEMLTIRNVLQYLVDDLLHNDGLDAYAIAKNAGQDVLSRAQETGEGVVAELVVLRDSPLTLRCEQEILDRAIAALTAYRAASAHGGSEWRTDIKNAPSYNAHKNVWVFGGGVYKNKSPSLIRSDPEWWAKMAQEDRPTHWQEQIVPPAPLEPKP